MKPLIPHPPQALDNKPPDAVRLTDLPKCPKGCALCLRYHARAAQAILAAVENSNQEQAIEAEELEAKLAAAEADGGASMQRLATLAAVAEALDWGTIASVRHAQAIAKEAVAHARRVLGGDK